MVLLVVWVLTNVPPAMPHVSTTHSARILMAATSASAMMASFSTMMMALLSTMLTNALLELTHLTQQHKNVETLLVTLHVNVNLDSLVMAGSDGDSNFHTDATCADTLGSFDCTYNDVFEGDGIISPLCLLMNAHVELVEVSLVSNNANVLLRT